MILKLMMFISRVYIWDESIKSIVFYYEFYYSHTNNYLNLNPKVIFFLIEEENRFLYLYKDLYKFIKALVNLWSPKGAWTFGDFLVVCL